jgi:hypothetical protein
MSFQEVNLTAEQQKNVDNMPVEYRLLLENKYKREKYQSIFLNKVKIKADPHRDCFSSGVDRFSRIDGNVLTKDDVDAIGEGKVGDISVDVYWSLDTSG